MGQVNVSFLDYYFSHTSTSLSVFLSSNIFLSLFISFIETAAVAIPPKIKPREKEAIIVISIEVNQ